MDVQLCPSEGSACEQQLSGTCGWSVPHLLVHQTWPTTGPFPAEAGAAGQVQGAQGFAGVGERRA